MQGGGDADFTHSEPAQVRPVKVKKPMCRFIDAEAELSGSGHEDGDSENDDAGSLEDFIVDDLKSSQENEENEEYDSEPELSEEQLRALDEEKKLRKKKRQKFHDLDLERERLELVRDRVEAEKAELEALKAERKRISSETKRRRVLKDDSESDEDDISNRSLKAPTKHPPTPPKARMAMVPCATLVRVLARPNPIQIPTTPTPPSISRAFSEAVVSPPHAGATGATGATLSGLLVIPPSRKSRMTAFKPEEPPPLLSNKDKWEFFAGRGEGRGLPPPPPASRGGSEYVFKQGSLYHRKGGVYTPSSGVDGI